MKDILANVTSGILIVCALTVTGFVLKEEWDHRSRDQAASADVPPVAVAGWNSLVADGTRMGKAGAPVTIVEYSDFQCPFCAGLQPVLERTRAKYGTRVSLVYRHFPIESIHPFSRPASLAAECAGAQGRFVQFHDALFTHQEAIGKVSWHSVAVGAGVADMARFDACVSSKQFGSRIDSDLRSGAQIGVNGTPTLIVNGMMMRGALTEDRINAQVERALAASSSGNAAPS